MSSRRPLDLHAHRVTPSGWVERHPDGPDEVVPWSEDPAWSRWDTVGRTLYTAATRRGTLAEVLQNLRQTAGLAHLERLAKAMGGTLEKYLALVDRDAAAAGMMPRSQVPRSWRDARLVYQVQLPASCWWVYVEHPDTLGFLSASTQAVDRLQAAGHSGPIDRSHVLGPHRRITATIAALLRSTMLFDGSYPLGVTWGSKLGYGDQWAVWLRQTDDGADPASDGVTVIGVGQVLAASDPDLVAVATSLNVHVH